eukprot:762165-Amphidinium_carterae.1
MTASPCSSAAFTPVVRSPSSRSPVFLSPLLSSAAFTSVARSTLLSAPSTLSLSPSSARIALTMRCTPQCDSLTHRPSQLHDTRAPCSKAKFLQLYVAPDVDTPCCNVVYYRWR